MYSSVMSSSRRAEVRNLEVGGSPAVGDLDAAVVDGDLDPVAHQAAGAAGLGVVDEGERGSVRGSSAPSMPGPMRAAAAVALAWWAAWSARRIPVSSRDWNGATSQADSASLSVSRSSLTVPRGRASGASSAARAPMSTTPFVDGRAGRGRRTASVVAAESAAAAALASTSTPPLRFWARPGHEAGQLGERAVERALGVGEVVGRLREGVRWPR